MCYALGFWEPVYHRKSARHGSSKRCSSWPLTMMRFAKATGFSSGRLNMPIAGCLLRIREMPNRLRSMRP